MSIAIISYSLTGNNRKLAAAVAAALSAEHIEVTTEKPRTMGAIMLDMVLDRTPGVQPGPRTLERYDRVLFLAPAWMGKVASPIRAHLKHLKAHPKPYAFVSISGGALNPNPKLAEDIAKRAGTWPAAFLDMHIAELFITAKKQATTKDTGDYRLTGPDVERLVGILRDSPIWRFCGDG